jgi:hypothetical protein
MRKTIYILLILVGFWQEIIAQTYLNVPLISQKQSNWCWAASIEMIVKYHNFNSRITQCQILTIYQEERHGESPCTFDSCECGINVCNLELERTTGMGITPYVDSVFDRIGFELQKSYEPLSWETIKNQIDNCQPIVLIIDRRILYGTNTGLHALVIDGYLENSCEKYLLIKDPWETCDTGCSYALNYDDLINKNTEDAIVSSICWLHSIKPKNGKNICDVPKPIDRPTFKDIYPCPSNRTTISIEQYKNAPTTVMKKSVSDLLGCFPNILPTATKLSFQNQANSLQKYKLYTISNQKIVDPKKYKRPFSNTKRLLYYSAQYDNFQIVMRKTKPYREKQTLLECPSRNIEGHWIIESFGTCSYICPNPYYCGVNIPVWVLNQYKVITFFEIVRYPLFNYNFRRFWHKNQYYYYSMKDYKDLTMGNNSYFKAKIAYSESLVFQQLHKKIIQNKP